MRSVRLLALASALLAAAPALAQDEFPDVPRNHWAYAALARMKKDGLLVGYPDGLYRGGRPASRYELAVALHAAWANLKNITDGLDASLRANSELTDSQRLKEAIVNLRTQLTALKGYGADVADLRRASDTFELELTQLGVDVQAMKDELKGLAGRIQTLESKKAPLEVSGRIDLWGGGGHAGDRDYGLTRDGRLTGFKESDPTDILPATPRAGITRDLTFLHEAAIDLASTNATGVKVRGTLVASNAFGQNPVDGVVTNRVAFGNQSDVFNPSSGRTSTSGLFDYSEGQGDVYLQTLAFSYEGPRYGVEAGRIQHQATPWILRRIDNTLYFDNPRWDNGDYTFDGARGSTNLGPVLVEAYGGTNRVQTVNGVLLNPLRTGPVNGPYGVSNPGVRMEADRLLGGTVATHVKGVGLRGDYLVVDQTTTFASPAFDQLHVFGGEADGRVGRFRLSGGLRQSQGYLGERRQETLAGNAWDAKVAWASGRFDLWGQYRAVQTNYLAPGDWGRLGVLRNPTNLEGFLGHARVDLTPRLGLSLEGEISHGLEDKGRAGTFFDRGTDIGRYGIRLDTLLGNAWNGYVRYEQTLFNDLNSPYGPTGSPRYQWYGVGVSKDVATNAVFSLAYEQSAIRDDYQTAPGSRANYHGGFLTSQVTVKF